MNPYPLKYSAQIEIEDYKSFFEEIMQHTEGKHWGIPNPKPKYELVGKATGAFCAGQGRL